MQNYYNGGSRTTSSIVDICGAQFNPILLNCGQSSVGGSLIASYSQTPDPWLGNA